MSLSNAIMVSMGSLQAINTQIRTVADNVANASNPNYNRQSVRLSNRELGGVQIDEVARAASKSLSTDYNTAISEASYNSQAFSLFKRVEELFGTVNGVTPLSNLVNDFETAWKNFEATPSNETNKSDVILRAADIITEIKRISDGIETIDDNLQKQISDDVASLNNALVLVGELNGQINFNNNTGQEINSLENQRDEQISIINKFVDATRMERAKGSLAIYTKSGIDLVDKTASVFTYNPLQETLSKSGFAGDATQVIGKGEISAKLNVMKISAQDVSNLEPEFAFLQKIKNRLDEIAYAFVDDATAVAKGSIHLDYTNDLTKLTNLADTLADGDEFQISANGGVATTIKIETGIGANDLVNIINTKGQAMPSDYQFRARIDGHGQLEISTTNGTLEITDGPNGKAATALGLETILHDKRNPPTFARAYKDTTTESNEATVFFAASSGTTEQDLLTVNRNNIVLNPDLRDGSLKIKVASGTAVVESLTSATRSDRGSASFVFSVTYTGLASTLLTDTSKLSNSFESRMQASEGIRDNLKRSLSNTVGVNVDEELSVLSSLQNSYAASARIIEISNQLFAELQRIV